MFSKEKLDGLKDKLKDKKLPLRLIMGTVALGIVGGAIAYGWVVVRNLGPKNLPVGVEAVPQDALMTMTVSTDTAEWRQLRRFGTPETQAQWDGVLVEWRDRLLSDNGFDFETDIRPWVGDDITVALLPEATDAIVPPGENREGLTQPLVVLLPIADVAAARAMLGEEEGRQITPRDYRGIELQEMQETDGTTMIAAVLSPKLVLVATTSGAAEAAIDAFKGGKSIADLTGYENAVSQAQKSEAFAEFYLNLPQVTQAIALNTEPPLPAVGLIPFKQNQGMVGSLELRGDGIHIRGVSWLTVGSDRTYAVDNSPSTLARKLPASTLMMASGLNLRQFWINYSQGATAGSLLPFNPDNLRVALQTTTGLDLDADILSWMEGEFAIAVVEAPESERSAPDPPNQAPDEAGAGEAVEPVELPVGFAFLVTVSDRSAADETLAQLDKVVGDRYRFDVETVDLDGVAAIRWTSPFQSLVMTHGWLDSDTAFFTLGEGVAKMIVPNPRRSLAETKLFQTTTSLAPKDNNGHFFVDTEQILQTESLFQPQVDESGDAQPITSVVEALGVTAAIADNRNVVYDVYVLLKAGRRPGALPDSKPQPEPEPDGATEEADPPAETP
ncbi:MAG: DUF3352 domain-containing protein [Cyanobacteria bacterium J06642_9]